MKTIIIKTQEELDALPDSFTEFTVIEIRSNYDVLISVKNAIGSSSVEAHGSSSVVAYDSRRVVAYGSSRVEAHGSSSVEAHGSSSVVAHDSSSVVAYGSSRVVTHDSSSVVAHGSSSVVAYGSSSVEAYGSSRVEVHGSSSVVAFHWSTIQVFSCLIYISLLDYSVAFLHGNKIKINKSETATVIKSPSSIESDFKEHLKNGYVSADGITKKLISKKKIGKIEVFEVEEFLERKSSYVVKSGNTFSHGETIEKAIEGLRYKLTDRDTTKYKKWKLEDTKSVDELIQAYRAITGACEFGVKQFCESSKLKKEYKIKDVIKLTEGKYGNEKFKEFFE